MRINKCVHLYFIILEQHVSSILRTSWYLNTSNIPQASLWMVPATAHNLEVCNSLVEYSWNVMAHGDEWEGNWRGNWRMEWVASTRQTTSENGVSNVTTTDACTSATSSHLNWDPRRFKRTRPFRRKTKSGFYACVSSHFKRSLRHNGDSRLIRNVVSPFTKV